MAIAFTTTVGTTDYSFDWVAQQIHIEALVTEVSAIDLKTAIHAAQYDTQGISFDPIADFFNPVDLVPGSTATFLNVVLRDQWRVQSDSVVGILVVGGGNVVNVNNGIDIFATNVLVNMVNNTSQAGVYVSAAGVGITQQEVRDAMKLDHTDGDASVDLKLNNNFAVSAASL